MSLRDTTVTWSTCEALLLTRCLLSCPQEADRSFSSLLNISARPGCSEDKVTLAVTLLLQKMELAALATALRSPEVTQTIEMESMGEENAWAWSMDTIE